jgi:hypothetical protein
MHEVKHDADIRLESEDSTLKDTWHYASGNITKYSNYSCKRSYIESLNVAQRNKIENVVGFLNNLVHGW